MEDHQNMLRQLRITSLRPGPSGNESAPNHANFDETLANPFPKLPELLVCNDGAAEAEFGSRNAGDIPVDAHQLIALCAPRLVFISYGIPEKGDAKWLDQQGSYMATVAAQPAYRLCGAETLGVSDDYVNEKMPAVNVGLLSGSLAWHQHDGGHTSGPNLPLFLEWASQKFAASVPAAQP